MIDSTVDRRVRKTKKQLRQGLAELLKTKQLKDISVREISDLVDINRGTFYLHYRDIYDMLEQIEDEVFKEFSQIIKNTEKQKGNPTPIIVNVFAYLADNAGLCGALLGKNGDINFVNRMKTVVRDVCLSGWKQAHGKTDDKDFEYFYAFLTSGYIGILETWLNNGMKESPQEMAVLISLMVQGCLVKIKDKG